MLHVLACDEVEYGDAGRARWHYSLAPGIDPSALQTAPDLLVPTLYSLEERANPGFASDPSAIGPDISGAVPPQVTGCLWCGKPIPVGQHYCTRVCAEAHARAAPNLEENQ